MPHSSQREASSPKGTSSRAISEKHDTQLEDLEAGEASTHDSPCIDNSVEVVEPPVPTSKNETKDAADMNESPEPQEECRICLMNDEIAQLVKPCHCIGSGKF